MCRIAPYCFGLLLVLGITNCKPESNADHQVKSWPMYQGISLLGDSLFAVQPPDLVLKNLADAESEYHKDPSDLDKIIWYGRRIAYTGDYIRAIEVYSDGIRLYPNESRLYRHRGHRYISTRQYAAALADYSKAVLLISGQENSVEPDGIPNARNTPVSTRHGNIWYHKGLTEYLLGDFDSALTSFQQCRATGQLPDNLVSSTHWIYMLHRLLGQEAEAAAAVKGITPDMDIIENMAYHKLCLFYQGAIDVAELSGSADPNYLPGGDAIAYGLANWYYYNGEMQNAKAAYTAILERPSWNSFGYIAAEADYKRYFID